MLQARVTFTMLYVVSNNSQFSLQGFLSVNVFSKSDTLEESATCLLFAKFAKKKTSYEMTELEDVLFGQYKLSK